MFQLFYTITYKWSWHMYYVILRSFIIRKIIMIQLDVNNNIDREVLVNRDRSFALKIKFKPIEIITYQKNKNYT